MSNRREFKPVTDITQFSEQRKEKQTNIINERRERKLKNKRKMISNTNEDYSTEELLTSVTQLVNLKEQNDISQLNDNHINNLQKLLNIVSSSKFPSHENEYFVYNPEVISSFLWIIYNSKKITIQSLSAWCIANLASVNHEQSSILMNQCIDFLLELLSSPILSTQLKEAYLWSIANFSGCCNTCREQIIQKTQFPIFKLLNNIILPISNSQINRSLIRPNSISKYQM